MSAITSDVVVKYGDWNFALQGLPIPQVGIRESMRRAGDGNSAPGPRQRQVTLQGRITGSSHAEIARHIRAMDAAFCADGKVLYWHDGTNVHINHVAYVQTIDIPAEWQQFEAHYTITLTYHPLDDTYTAPAKVQYGSFVFCDTSGNNANKPIPTISKSYRVSRDSQDATRRCDRITVTLSGTFQEGSIAANQAKLDALETALRSDDTLIFGSWTQAVKVQNWSFSPNELTAMVVWSIEFSYAANTGASGVRELSSRRIIERNTVRSVPIAIPFVDYLTSQSLGAGDQTITAEGFCVADSLAQAKTAAIAEIASMLPAGGVENRRRILEDAYQMRVDWTVVHWFGTPTLTGGIYG
jgi:hypothetical protein